MSPPLHRITRRSKGGGVAPVSLARVPPPIVRATPRLPRRPTMSRSCCTTRPLGVLLLLLIASPALAQVNHTEVTDQMLLGAKDDAKNWLTYGKDYSNTRYVTSTQINAQNVGSLVPRWVYQTSGPIGSFETTPLVVDGGMYLTTPYNHAIAVDARTGQQLWRYEHKLTG